MGKCVVHAHSLSARYAHAGDGTMNEEQLREFRTAAETLITALSARFPDTSPERMKNVLDDVINEAVHDTTTPIPELTMRMLTRIYSRLLS